MEATQIKFQEKKRCCSRRVEEHEREALDVAAKELGEKLDCRKWK